MVEKKAHQDQRRRESDSVFLAGLEFGASHLGHNPAVLSEMEKLDQKKKKIRSLRRTRENSSVVAAVCSEVGADVCVCVCVCMQCIRALCSSV